MSKLIDTTGKKFGSLVVVKELGRGKVVVKCDDCGYISEHNKMSVIHRGARCRNCKLHGKTVDKTGEVYYGLKIIKELGNRRVITRCTSCGLIKERDKGSVMFGNAGCGCRLDYIIGKIFGNFMVVKELGRSKIVTKCIHCGDISERNKFSVFDEKSRCKNCQLHGKIIDKTGEIYNNFKIVKELGGNRVVTQCLSCGQDKERDKRNVISGKVRCSCEK